MPVLRSPSILAATASAAFLGVAANAQVLPGVRAAEALGARTGVYAIDIGEKRPIHVHRADEAFVPASNQKVLTAIAVVAGLGFGFEFETRSRLRAGRLEIEASGDPNWETGSEHDPARMFDAIAIALFDAGVRAVRGIDLQDGPFTGPTRPPTWPNDQLDTYYCAPTGPFVLDAGCFRARVAPTNGAAAAVELLAPIRGAAIDGRIAMSTRKDAVYGFRDDAGRVLARGAMPRGAGTVVVKHAVADPRDWYERALRARLDAAGIRVAEDAPAIDLALPVLRTPLAPALGRMVQESSNFHAEQLLRVLGAKHGDGSLAGGVAAMAHELGELVGPLPADASLVDGSGLSRGNRLTPRLLGDALEVGLRQVWRGALLDALPRAGEDGTVERRFTGRAIQSRVRAKTGWIRGASSLSGIVTLEDGRLRVFAIQMNYDPKLTGLNRRLKLLQEQIVEQLAELRE